MARPPWSRYAKLAVKTGVGIVVLLAVGRHVGRTWADLQERGESLRVEPAWLVVAGLLYIVGLSAFGVFFSKILEASPSPVALAPALRAYVISHLGKYVPGKAMVVVMRVGMVVPHGARAVTAALATFYETFVMMAAGALIAVAGFGLGPSPVQPVPLALAGGLAVAFLVAVDPLVFPRVSRLVTMPFPKVGPGALPFFTRRLLAAGLAWSAAGWVLLGLSQVAVVRALTPGGVAPGLWPLVTASVALATAAGFVVPVLPGGLGVREGVLMTTLAPALGDDRSVIAALALRLTWVLAEVAAASVLAVVRPAIPPPPLATPSEAPSARLTSPVPGAPES
jgi:uncharacterized membrane protein YbhN (UPF0104 family)